MKKLVVTQALRGAVQEVLVEMAMNFELDGDMNALDIDDVFDRAVENVKNNDLAKALHESEVLGHFITHVNLLTARRELKEAFEDGKGEENADYHVDIAERFEHQFTVEGLLNEIGI